MEKAWWGTYALRKTILPIRPKPLMPTSVSDMIVFNVFTVNQEKCVRESRRSACRYDGDFDDG